MFGNERSTTTMNPPTSCGLGGTGGGLLILFVFKRSERFTRLSRNWWGGDTGLFGQTSNTQTSPPATGTGTTGTRTTITAPGNIFDSKPSGTLSGATSTTSTPGMTVTKFAPGGGLFGGPTSAATPGDLFGGKRSTPVPARFGSLESMFGNTTNPAPSTGRTTTTTSLYGGGTTGTGTTLFGAPMPADAKDLAKPGE